MRGPAARAALGDLTHAVIGCAAGGRQVVTASSADGVFALAPEAATLVGFSRAVFRRVDQGIWSTQYAHAVGDSEFGEKLVALRNRSFATVGRPVARVRDALPPVPHSGARRPDQPQGLPQISKVRLRHRLRGCARAPRGTPIGMVHATAARTAVFQRSTGAYWASLPVGSAWRSNVRNWPTGCGSSTRHRRRWGISGRARSGGGTGAPWPAVSSLRRRPCRRPVVIAGGVGCASQHRVGKDERSDRRRLVP